MNFLVIFIVFNIVVGLGTIFFWIQRYKRCPSDKILVVYGKTQGVRSSKCIHGGACFVWPVIQDFQWLDLTPIPIGLGEKEFSPNEKDRVKIVSNLTTGISTETGIMENAAERLLGLNMSAIRELAFDITQGCMRSVVKEFGSEAIKSDPDSLVDRLGERLDAVLKEIGLKVINLDIKKVEVTLSEGSSYADGISTITPIPPPAIEETLPDPGPLNVDEDNPSSVHHAPKMESDHSLAKDQPLPEEEPSKLEGGNSYSPHQLS
jgi:uncharacterized membrane protein YqiK